MDVPIVSVENDNLDGLEWDVVVCNPHETEYGTKVQIESPFQAKDVIKDLEWERTHRAWDEESKRWTVDLESVGLTVMKLNDAGFSSVVTEDVARELEE